MTSRAEELFKQLTAAPDPEFVARLTALFQRCENAANEQSEPIEPLLEEAKKLTGTDWVATDFEELWSWTSAGELAEEKAVCVPTCPDLSVEELGDLLGLHTEGFPDASLRFLSETFGDAFSTDLIFWPHKKMDSSELAREIFHRKSLIEQEGPGALHAYERELSGKT